MREILTDRQQDIYNRVKKGETYEAVGKSYGVTRERIRQVYATAVRKKGEVATKWINLKDEQPETAGQMFLVFAQKDEARSVFTAFCGYGDNKWYTYDTMKMAEQPNNQVDPAWKITHWQYLPQPPEREE